MTPTGWEPLDSTCWACSPPQGEKYRARQTPHTYRETFSLLCESSWMFPQRRRFSLHVCHNFITFVLPNHHHFGCVIPPTRNENVGRLRLFCSSQAAFDRPYIPIRWGILAHDFLMGRYFPTVFRFGWLLFCSFIFCNLVFKYLCSRSLFWECFLRLLLRMLAFYPAGKNFEVQLCADIFKYREVSR